MNVIIRRGTALPIKVSSNFTTSTDNQTAVTIQVFEGERAWAKDNNFLGQVELSGIDPAPKGIPQITVNFQVDYNGILYVTAQDKNSAKGNLTVLTNKGRPTADDIHRMILEIDVFKMVEEKQRQRLLLMNKLETYIFDVKRFIEIHDDQVRVEDRTRAKKACEKVLIWLESNRHAPKEDFQQKLVSLKAICSPVISQLIGCSSSS
ncbi:unnamed protein product [Candidula unifasciata]|uniref:Heat shock protein 70 n=1 Tax=Candidula unifasciata TaxID=100452 RepID=A0A8S3Z6E2_9EUPU|nr:unnamed protein product [Candidula unifasciata]